MNNEMIRKKWYYNDKIPKIASKLLLEFNKKSIINKLKEIILDYINEKNLESYKLAVELLKILKKLR